MSEQERVKTIHIETAVEFGGKTYNQLDLREFTVGERLKAETHPTQTAQYVQLLSSVSGWPVPALHLLPNSVFEEAIRFLEGFLKSGPQTGES